MTRSRRTNARWLGSLLAMLVFVGLGVFGARVALAQAPAAPPPVPPAPAEAKQADQAETLTDRWYKLELAGSPAGWMHSTVVADATTYRTSTETWMRINRGAQTLEIALTTMFEETRDGRPLRIASTQDLSAQIVESEWIFEDDHVRSVTRQGGRTVESRLELPDIEWLTPMAVQTLMREKLKAGADAFEYLTIDGQNGVEPTRFTFKRTGEEVFSWDGREVPVVVWETTVSVLGGMTGVSKISHDGHVVHDESEFPFGRAVNTLVTEAEARAAANAPGPELFVTTFIPVEPRVPRASRTTTARMRLRAQAGKMPALPNAGAQRFEPEDDPAEAIIRVDLGDALPAQANELEDEAYRTPSAMVDSADPLVIKLAQRACRDAGDEPMARADALRTFVSRHISDKDLDTAFATASETARMRTGDCSEHGILLCAMLRAEDIPARVATGLVYVDQMFGRDSFFGWHMWTQALIDGRWIDLDATLENRYNALHVLTATSSMSDASGVSDLATVMQLMGNLEIEIEDVGYDDAAGASDAR